MQAEIRKRKGNRIMDEEIRKARSRQYGSFLYCPDRDCLCFGRETDLECKHESCILDDPEYQALQKRIEENRKRNELKALRENPNTSHRQVIRRQTKTAAELLEERIRRKEQYARECYRANYPKRGDDIVYEIVRIRAKLRKLKEGGR